MFEYTTLFVLFLLFAFLFPDQGSPDYVALGDSLTVGVAAIGGHGFAYCFYKWLLAYHCLPACGYRNLGVIGWRSADLLMAVNQNPYYQRSIQQACIITLDIGGNDIIKSRYSPELLENSLREYANNLRSIICQIRLLNSKAELYMMNIYNPYPSGHPLHAWTELWVTRYNNVIWDVYKSNTYNINGLADIYSVFKGNEEKYTLLALGSKHPNAAGHYAICQCFQHIKQQR